MINMILLLFCFPQLSAVVNPSVVGFSVGRDHHFKVVLKVPVRALLKNTKGE